MLFIGRYRAHTTPEHVGKYLLPLLFLLRFRLLFLPLLLLILCRLLLLLLLRILQLLL